MNNLSSRQPQPETARNLTKKEGGSYDPLFDTPSAASSLSVYEAWLTQIGLNFDPFQYINAGEDPNIPLYLIEHGVYSAIKGLEPAAVFARPGFGKTAFRVRLTNDCRTDDKLGVFPITFMIPEEAVGSSRRYEDWDALIRSAANEFLLYCAYHEDALQHCSPADQQIIRQLFSFLALKPAKMFVDFNTWQVDQPILKDYDPTAVGLPNPPGIRIIKNLCDQIAAIPPVEKRMLARDIFAALVRILREVFQFNGIFLLVDGVDAYYETVHNPEIAYQVIQWLVTNSTMWEEQSVYLKLFLPDDLQPHFVNEAGNLLTPIQKIATIYWDRESLKQIVRERLHAASGGRFDSLIAIAGKIEKREIEDLIVQEVEKAGRMNPRDVVRLVEFLLRQHDSQKNGEKLTQQDLNAALERYRKEPGP